MRIFDAARAVAVQSTTGQGAAPASDRAPVAARDAVDRGGRDLMSMLNSGGIAYPVPRPVPPPPPTRTPVEVPLGQPLSGNGRDIRRPDSLPQRPVPTRGEVPAGGTPGRGRTEVPLPPPPPPPPQPGSRTLTPAR
jgi:hypothetical protein